MYLKKAFVKRYNAVGRIVDSKYIDLRFFARFILLYLVLDYGNRGYYGLISPDNTYVPFLDNYVNYPNWIIQSILQVANGICMLLGYDTYVTGIQLRLHAGAGVQLAWACIGLGMMSFWIAFIAAHVIDIRKKIQWMLMGVAAIWFINCCRIALLLIVFGNNTNLNDFMDHHTAFNIAAYTLIALLIWKWDKNIKKEKNKIVPQLAD